MSLMSVTALSDGLLWTATGSFHSVDNCLLCWCKLWCCYHGWIIKRWRDFLIAFPIIKKLNNTSPKLAQCRNDQKSLLALTPLNKPRDYLLSTGGGPVSRLPPNYWGNIDSALSLDIKQVLPPSMSSSLLHLPLNINFVWPPDLPLTLKRPLSNLDKNTLNFT